VSQVSSKRTASQMKQTEPRWQWDRRKTLGATILAVALVATACSESGANESQSAPDTTAVSSKASSSLSLSGVSVDSSAIEELDVLRFSGIDLDGDLSELELHAIVDGIDPVDMLLFVDDGGLHTIFPLHPEHPGSGGDVTLRLSSGGEQASEFDLEIIGLPAAPGAWDRIIESMVHDLESRADLLGTSLSELAEAPMSDVSDDAAIVKLIAGYVDDGTVNDLESLLVRPGEELSAEEIGLVDSIVAKIGLAQMIPPPLDLVSVEALGSSAQTVSAHDDGAPRVTAMRAAHSWGGSCRTKVISITNEAELAAAVERGIGAQRSQGGAVDKLTKDVTALSSSSIGKVPVVGSGVAAFVGAVDAMYATMGLWFEADAGNYPTRFVSLTAKASHPAFNEDFLKPGDVSSVTVVAASSGFDASEGFEKVATKAESAVVSAAVGKLQFSGAKAVETGYKKVIDAASAKAVAEYADQNLQFCGQQWTVVLKSPKYVDISAVIGRIEVDKGSWTYKPLDLGDDILRVRARSDAFSGLTASVDIPIETRRLQVISTPGDIEVKRAGEIVDITTDLKNADTTTLLWEGEQGKWADGKGEATNDAATRPLETPTNKDLYPFMVVVESTSETGLRKAATDVRNDQVWITLQDLIVLPDPGKVRKNNPLQFTATDDDGNPRDVTWTATGGTIDESSGLYVAGGAPGTYSVTATAVDDPSVSETVTVTIYDGECIIGTWVLRSDDFFSQIGEQFGGAISYRSGENRLIVSEDGSYTAIRDAWSYEVASSEGVIVGIISAENPGSWITTETELAFTEAGGSDVTVELLIEMGGKLVPLPFNAGSTQVPSGPTSGEFPYTCEADVFTTTASGVTSVFDRVDN